MKKLFLFMFCAATLFASVALPARAGVVVEDVVVRRQGADVNIRVTVHNDTAARVKAPVFTLYVRKDDAAAWVKVKTWNDITMIQPHYKVSRDYFDENNAMLRALAASGSFQAKATVQAPGLTEGAEKISIWSDSAP